MQESEHNPPTAIVLSPGLYEHTCPGCGRTQQVSVKPNPSMDAYPS